jgi:tRNA (mo5U34)-methyltransferase
MSVDVNALGSFDVVLYLGVLYHMQEPFEALKRVARVTRELAVIETEAIHLEGYEEKALFEFYGSNELNGDVSNWWAPTEQGLRSMCLAAGFRDVRVLTHPGAPSSAFSRIKRELSGSARTPHHYRLIVQALK